MTESLQDLEDAARISPTIIRVMGGNPGKFTLQGTNTYLISAPVSSIDEVASIPCILIDTGEGRSSYEGLLGSVLQGKESRVGSTPRYISDVILTHWHHDHIGGLPSVLSLSRSLGHPRPRLHKLRETGADDKVAAMLDRLSDELTQHIEPAIPTDVSGPAKGHDLLSTLIHPLRDGDVVETQTTGTDAKRVKLQVIHSPGHTADHVCVIHLDEGIMLTGDHVLGQGTSVFEDLGAYLLSLRKCKAALAKACSTDCGPASGKLLPAHGPPIEDGHTAIQAYLDHRLAREEQILQLLATNPSEEADQVKADPVDVTRSATATSSCRSWTISDIVSKLYSEYPESLYPAAARGIYLHLRKMALPDQEALQRRAVPATLTDGSSHDGRRVRCCNAAGEDESSTLTASFMPQDDAAWLQVMELQWSLLPTTEVTAPVSRGAL